MIRSRQGSAAVEAALVYPLVILLLASVIRQSLFLYGEVRDDSLAHRDEILSTFNPAGADVCLLMRGKWLLP